MSYFSCVSWNTLIIHHWIAQWRRKIYKSIVPNLVLQFCENVVRLPNGTGWPGNVGIVENVSPVMVEWQECNACSTTAEPGSCGTIEIAAGVTLGASTTLPDSSGCESGIRCWDYFSCYGQHYLLELLRKNGRTWCRWCCGKVDWSNCGQCVEAALLGLLVVSLYWLVNRVWLSDFASFPQFSAWLSL